MLRFFFGLCLIVAVHRLDALSLQKSESIELAKRDSTWKAERAKHWNLGVSFYGKANLDSAAYHFEQAMLWARKFEGPSYWKGKTTEFLSLSLIDSNPERSLLLYNQAIENFRQTRDNGRLSEVYRVRANEFKRRGNRSEALTIFEEGYNYIRDNILDLGDSNAYMVMQRNIVAFHLEIGDTQRALEQLESSLIPYGTVAYEPYQQYADVYRQLGKYEKAVDYYYKALEHQKQETAYNLTREYKSQEDSLRQLSMDTLAIAYRMNSLAEGLLSIDQLELAKAYMDTSMIYFSENGDNKIYVINDLAQYAIQSKDFAYAQDLLEELDKNLNIQADQEEFQQFYELKMRLNAAIGEYESFENWRLKKDSIDKKILNEGRISVIETQRILDNTRAQQIQGEQEARILQQRMINILLGIGAIIFFVLFSYFRRTSKKMQALSNRNELLVREQNHRVKNNLQMINSLLSLQAGRLKDEQSKDILKSSQTRIQAISLLNRSLYEQKDISHVDIKAYIEELSQDVINSVTNQEVNAHVNVASLEVNIDKATSLGLIINELIVNSIKHANGQQAGFELNLNKEGDQLLLHYKDQNDGFELSNYKSSRSFGKRLIELQSHQLKGELELIHSSQFELKLVFPL